MKKLFLFVVAPLIFLCSCDKDDDDTTSKKDLLMKGTWQITAMMMDGDGDGSYDTDLYAGLDACVKDNFFIFKANELLELNEGGEKCSPTDPQTNSLDWQLMQNDTRLVIDSDEYIVDLLNETTLRIKDDMPSYGMMITFTKR